MAYVYATLIIKEEYEYKNLPPKMKDKVKQLLISMDCAEYIVE